MQNPVLVEVTRGHIVESRHRGMVVAVDGDGKVVFSSGEIDTPVFPRSACKAMQGLPLIESGAADAYGFGQKELALACASHSGEPEHVALAASMLARAGQDVTALECGAHWSGEEHYDADRAARIEAALSEARCGTLDADEQALRREHAGNAAVLDILARAETM